MTTSPRRWATPPSRRRPLGRGRWSRRRRRGAPSITRRCNARRWTRPAAAGMTRSALRRGAARPTRLPVRAVRNPTAATAATARSRFVVAAVPKSRLGDRSTTTHVSSSRSAIVSRMWAAACGPSRSSRSGERRRPARTPALRRAPIRGRGRGRGSRRGAGRRGVATPELERRSTSSGRPARPTAGCSSRSSPGRQAWAAGSWLRRSTRGAGHRRQDPGEDVFDLDALGQRLVRQHQAVAHDVGRHVEHVLGHDVGAAAQQRERPSGGDQAEAGPRLAP